MAVKDSLRYFKDDSYENPIEKKDIDNNFQIIADSIGMLETEDRIEQQNKEITKFQLHTSTANGNYSVAIGIESETNSILNMAFGNRVKTTAIGASAYGVDFTNKQVASTAYGWRYDSATIQINRSFKQIKTTDDTESDFMDIELFPKMVCYLKLNGVIYQDDYSTKWIFVRDLVIRTDSDGKITIDKDDNNNIIKDNDDWKLEIEGTDDNVNPKITLKITGKADTNISWGMEVENRMNYWD